MSWSGAFTDPLRTALTSSTSRMGYRSGRSPGWGGRASSPGGSCSATRAFSSTAGRSSTPRSGATTRGPTGTHQFGTGSRRDEKVARLARAKALCDAAEWVQDVGRQESDYQRANVAFHCVNVIQIRAKEINHE